MTTDWPDWKDPAVKCAELHKLDARFGTCRHSPLHHDNRCDLHERDPRPLAPHVIRKECHV